jgi:hypothetical protein
MLTAFIVKFLRSKRYVWTPALAPRDNTVAATLMQFSGN